MTITAQSAMQAGVRGGFSEVLGAEGEVSTAYESNRLPLEGEVEGAREVLTELLQAVLDGARKDPKIFGPLPETVNCTVSQLRNGQVSVSLETLESGELKVTVEPAGGVFIHSCGGTPLESAPITWFVIRELKGMGPDEPFVFVFDRGKRTGNVIGALEMIEGVARRTQPDE